MHGEYGDYNMDFEGPSRFQRWSSQCKPCANNQLKTVGIVFFAALAIVCIALLIAGLTSGLPLGDASWAFLGGAVLCVVIGGYIYFCGRSSAPTGPTLSMQEQYEQERRAQGMAEEIRSKDEIADLTHIRGVPVEVIETRLKTEGKPMLAQSESFGEVLENNWKTVEILGETHITMAERLHRFFEAAKAQPYKEVACTSHFQNHPAQQLTIGYVEYHSFTQDSFRPEDPKDQAQCRYEAWNDFCTIKNGDKSVTFSSGTLRYIRRYGFWGGTGNEYHCLDPLALVSVLTGQSVEDLKHEVRNKLVPISSN